MRQVLDGDSADANPELLNELEFLDHAVKTVSAELAASGADTIRETDLPVTRDELEAIINAAETATNSIMEVAEEIEGAAAELDTEIQGKLNDAVMRIYEACGFQDITGQRITKVLHTLTVIEAKIDGILSACGDTARPNSTLNSRPATNARMHFCCTVPPKKGGPNHKKI